MKEIDYMRVSRRATLSFILTILCILALPALALGQGEPPPGPAEPAPLPDGPALTGLPLGIIIVSFVMTAIGYGLNYLLPFLKTDKAKGIAHAAYQLIGIAAYEVVTSSDFGFNEQTVAAFVVALGTFGVSHGLLYKPTGWATALGAGRNKDGPDQRYVEHHPV